MLQARQPAPVDPPEAVRRAGASSATSTSALSSHRGSSTRSRSGQALQGRSATDATGLRARSVLGFGRRRVTGSGISGAGSGTGSGAGSTESGISVDGRLGCRFGDAATAFGIRRRRSSVSIPGGSWAPASRARARARARARIRARGLGDAPVRGQIGDPNSADPETSVLFARVLDLNLQMVFTRRPFDDDACTPVILEPHRPHRTPRTHGAAIQLDPKDGVRSDPEPVLRRNLDDNSNLGHFADLS